MAESVKVVFEDAAADTLLRLGRATGLSNGQVISDALGLYEFALGEVLAGRCLAVIDEHKASFSKLSLNFRGEAKK